MTDEAIWIEGVLAPWLGELAVVANRSEATLRAYRTDLVGYLRIIASRSDRDDALRMADIALVRRWLAELQSRDLDPASVKRALSALKSFYRWMERVEGIDAGRILALRGPRAPRRLPRSIAEPAAIELAHHGADGPRADEPPWLAARDAAIFALMYGSGLRISEALGLLSRDAPLPLALTLQGKGGKTRTVPILHAAIEGVERYLQLIPFPLQPDGPLFRGEKGGALQAPVLRRRFAAARLRLGLDERATPHSLRHAFATHLLAHGVELKAIQQLLGHSSLGVTQVYTAVDEARLGAAWRAAHPRV